MATTTCYLLLRLAPNATPLDDACSRWPQNGEPVPFCIAYFFFSSLLAFKNSLCERALIAVSHRVPFVVTRCQTFSDAGRYKTTLSVFKSFLRRCKFFYK